MLPTTKIYNERLLCTLWTKKIFFTAVSIVHSGFPSLHHRQYQSIADCVYYVCAKEQSSLTHHDVGALHGHVEGRVVGGEVLGAADEGGGRSRGEGIGRSGEGGNEGENGLHLDGYNATGGMSWSASA